LVPNKSTKDVTIRNSAGLIVHTETHVYTGSGNFTQLNSVDYTYDFAGRLTQSVASNGATKSYVYTNGVLTDMIDESGIETQFTAYDSLNRVLTSVKKSSTGVAGSVDISTTNTYDGQNNVTQVVTTGGSLSLTASSSFDLAGRLYQSIAPGGYTTGYVYSSGGRIVTATMPGGGTKITENYTDGRLKTITGTGVINEFLSYGVDSTSGQLLSQHRFSSWSSGAWVNSYTDWLGRQAQEWKPAWGGSTAVTIITHDYPKYSFGKP
jgi:YD repeat-containing protein